MTPLVLLPGMMCDDRLYAPQVAALSTGREVTVASITDAATVEALAAHVLADAPPRFALGGLSMGGIVAMEVARQAPDRVAGLALLDTNPLAEAAHIAARREPQIARVEAEGLRAIMEREVMPWYLAEGADRPDLLALCLDMGLALGPDVFARQSRALRDRPDQTGTLRAFGRPALILCGEGDRLCPPKRHTLMQGLMADSTLVLLPDTGHIATLERPGEVSDALETWLARV